jgi:hypothetical protein
LRKIGFSIQQLRQLQYRRLSGQDIRDRTAGTGYPEQNSRDRISGTEQPGRISGTGQPGYDSWDRPSGTDSRDRTAGAGEPGLLFLNFI